MRNKAQQLVDTLKLLKIESEYIRTQDPEIEDDMVKITETLHVQYAPYQQQSLILVQEKGQTFQEVDAYSNPTNAARAIASLLGRLPRQAEQQTMEMNTQFQHVRL